MLRWVAIAGLAAACNSTPQGPALAHVWDLDVDIPAGWTRENVQFEEFEGIRLRAPSGDPLGVYFVDGEKVRANARAWFDWKNHRYWNDEVKIVDLEETTVPDGWLAILTTQTRIRPTPDRDVHSQRTLGGRTVECAADRPHDPSVFETAVAVCKSVRLATQPGEGVHAAPKGNP